MTDASVTVLPNGPYLVSGDVPLTIETIGRDAEGGSWEWEPGAGVPASSPYALCRCGQSAGKPFCDGTHAKIGFDGTETASHAPYAQQAKVIDGPALTLHDAEPLCAYARFCDPKGGIWENTPHSDDPAARAVVEHEGPRCPSGRLVVTETAAGAALEPPAAPGIVLVQDPGKDCSGPLALRGSIPVRSKETGAYEVRARVTLCRCGASANKPFCDGSHADVGFRDGLG